MEKYRNFIFGMMFGMLLSLGIIAFSSASGFVIEFPGSAVQKVNKKARIIEKCIDEYYQGDVKDEDLADGAAKGMVSALGDKYSQYFTEQEYQELMNGINGSYVGIGVTLRQEDNQSIVVEDVSPGGPAAHKGAVRPISSKTASPAASRRAARPGPAGFGPKRLPPEARRAAAVICARGPGWP